MYIFLGRYKNKDEAGRAYNKAYVCKLIYD